MDDIKVKVKDIKKEECNFYEDSRKWRPIFYILCIVFYSFSIYELLMFILNKLDVIYLEESNTALLSGGTECLVFFIISLCLSIYLTFISCSKDLKYFMFITNNEIIFYSNKKIHIYNIKELKSYVAETETLKKAGGHGREYCFYTLHFNDSSYTITSFKPTELKAYFDKIGVPNLTSTN